MVKVVGIKFKNGGKLYYFAPKSGDTYTRNMPVIVETAKGLEYAWVAYPEKEIEDGEVVFAKCLEFALHNGVNTMNGEKVSVETGDPKTFETYERRARKILYKWNLFQKKYKYFRVYCVL